MVIPPFGAAVAPYAIRMFVIHSFSEAGNPYAVSDGNQYDPWTDHQFTGRHSGNAQISTQSSLGRVYTESVSPGLNSHSPNVSITYELLRSRAGPMVRSLCQS